MDIIIELTVTQHLLKSLFMLMYSLIDVNFLFAIDATEQEELQEEL